MVRLIIFVVILILVLSFFGVSLQNLISAPTTQANFGFAWDLVLQGWNIIVSFFTTLFSPLVHLFQH